MAGSEWNIQQMGDEGKWEEGEEEENGRLQERYQSASKVTKTSFFIRRLDLLKDRVKKRMAEGETLLNKMQQGEDITVEDELVVDQLELAINGFVTELRGVTLGEDCVEAEKWDEYTRVQLEAEDLLLIITKRNKKKKQEDLYRQPSRSNANITSRLPKMELLKFDGNKLKWYEFWGRFKSSVEGRTDLSDIDKLTYLLGLLEGEAKEVVEGLDMTDSNYEIAVNSLTQQFGRPDMIVDAHYEALHDIAPANDTTKDCRKVLNDIERHLKVLKTLGEDVDKNNQLRHMLPKKFPQSIRYDISVIMRGKENTVGNLRQSLVEVITARETSQFTTQEKKSPTNENSFTTETLLSTSSERKRPAPNQPRKFGNKKPHMMKNGPKNNQGNENNRRGDKRKESTQLVSHGNRRGPPPNKSPRISCFFCDENHYSDRCHKYPTVDERKSKMAGACFICLGHNHKFQQCSKKSLPCAHCKKVGHHRSLCYSKFKNPPKEGKQVAMSVFSSSKAESILQTAVATLKDSDSNCSTRGRLLFDTGSQRSYVTSEVVKRLHSIPVEETCLSVYTFGHSEAKVVESQLVHIQILTPHGNPVEIHAYVIPSITGLIPSFRHARDKLKREHPELELARDVEQDSDADVLIGNDHYNSFFTGKRKPVKGNLYVLESVLGWILSGCEAYEVNNEILSMITYVQEGQIDGNKRLFTVPDPPLQDDNIRDIWELESIGIRDSPKVLEEDEIIKFFNNTTVFQNNRYQVKWPWLQYPSDLPVNYGMAFGRLVGLMNRIDLPTLQQYDTVLKDQLSKGVIEIVEEDKLPAHPVHYLPHHCVVQENKTTKLRVVYDASAKSKGHCSLNEYLYKGPLMLEDLVSLVLRFRDHPIGIIADVEKAFLQIALQPEDRDVTRFLWLKDITKGATEDNVIHFRFCRVPFGVISSPFLLAAVIRHHLTQKHSKEADVIAKSLYVDNLVSGAQSVEDGCRLYQTATEAFKELSMNIRGWCTNSAELKEVIPEEQRDLSDLIATVLGLKWDTMKDTLKLAVSPTIFVRNVTTKRQILRIIASVFDPCGYVAPHLLPARVFLQRLWQEKYKWDSPLDEEKVTEWSRCVPPLQFTTEVEIPRYHFETSRSRTDGVIPKIEIHCFTDASKDAYAAVVYLRRIQDKDITVNMVMSRTKLTPIKSRDRMTIPKLELLGVLIGARLLNYVRDTLGLGQIQTFLWTDSQIVLRWMRSEKLLEPFVSRRISEVRSFSSIQFHYIFTKDNPADLATRMQYSPLPPLWFKGPPFLHLPDKNWAGESAFLHTLDCISSVDSVSPNDSGPSILQDSVEHEEVGQTLADEEEGDLVEDPASLTSQEGQPEKSTVQTDIESIKEAQRESYPKELAGVETHLTKSLGLFIDQGGLLRCKGRLQNAVLPYDCKFPILLPKNHPFTLQTIKKIHEDNYHVGVNQTLATHRKRFWVPCGRSQVTAVLKKCKQCIKWGGGPYKLPAMPPLPAERVQFSPPFTYIGLDYLGPLTVISENQHQKRWCCLFTCMASRAIRLETVNDLSAEEFLLCLRRFVALQGVPALIVSDNATQFKLAADIVQSPLCTENNLAWHFIPALSPWQGGFYERLVGLVKNCLRRTLDKNLLSGNQLTTVLKEIETVLNNRPLTAVGENLELTLSPADFMSSCGTHPLPVSGEDSVPNITATKSDLIAGWKRGQQALNEFKVMFQEQYLASLRERAITPHKQPRVLSKKEPRVGDVVQLGDDRSKGTNRGNWKVGKIEELIKSTDGQIRSAKVKLDSGPTVTRSTSLLYPLELSEDMSQKNNGPTPETASISNEQNDSIQLDATPPSSEVQPSSEQTSRSLIEPSNSPNLPQAAEQDPSANQSVATRPRRETAKVARDLIRQWTQSLSSIMANIK